MREYGLALCIYKFHQTGLSNDIKASLGLHSESMIAGYEQYEELLSISHNIWIAIKLISSHTLESKT